MEQLKEYIKKNLESFNDLDSKMAFRFSNLNFGDFLIQNAERGYKDYAVRGLFAEIDLIADASADKAEVVEHLNNLLKHYTKKRLYDKPILFNTNQMVNLTRLWEFELCGEFIKYLEQMLRFC